MPEENVKEKEGISAGQTDSLAESREPQPAGSEGQGLFHITRRYKWILGLSLLSILLEAVLCYATYHEAVQAAAWQIALWVIGLGLAVHAIAKKSLLSLLLNLLLVFGISFLPVWQSLYEFFKPVIQLFVDVP